MNKTITIVLLSAVLSIAGSIIGTITGITNGKPLPDVLALIETLNLSALTDSTGNYRIDAVPPGSYNLVFTKDTYEPLRQNDIFVSGEGEKRVDVELSPAPVSLDKMVVRGTAFRKAVDMAGSTKVMTFDEILRSPGALVDVQRAVQNLPSVAAAADNTNEIIVRGGAPGENLLLMDNIEIPNANQFAQQGSGGGVVSLISPLLVKGLTFNAGAPPAQYGGKASSVLDIKLRDGNDKLIVGGIDLGVAGIGGHVEGPLWKGSTFMASATKSYLDFISSFSPSTAVPKYWGGQAKITQRLGSHTITANGIYGDNSILFTNARKDLGLDDDVVKSGGTVYATGATTESFWNERLASSITLSATGNSFDRYVYTDTTVTGTTVSDSSFVNKSNEQEQTLKAQLSLDFGSRNRITIGVFGRRCDADIFLYSRPDSLREFITDTLSGTLVLDSSGRSLVNSQTVDRRLITYGFGGFITSTLYLGDRLKLVPGMRFDGLTYTNTLTFSPRLGAVVTLTPSLNLTGSAGIQYQNPDYVQLVGSTDGQSLKPKRAITAIAGMEYTWAVPQLQFVAEGFYKHYDHIPFDSSFFASDGFTKSNTVLSIGEGRSYGLELFAQKKLIESLSGSAAYSLSRSEQLDPRPGRNNAWYSGDFDFIQSITVTGGWKKDLLGLEWYQRLHKKLWFALLSPFMPVADRLELSAKWRYSGGRPYNKPTYSEENRRWMYDYSSLNTSRYPAYHTLDLRFERRYGFGFLQLIYYFDLKNIYARENLWSYMYANRTDTPTEIRQLPFFPAGGMILGF